MTRQKFVGSHFSEFPDLQVAHSSGHPGDGGMGACPQLEHRERSSRYPGQVRLSWISVGFNFFGDLVIRRSESLPKKFPTKNF